MTAKLDETHDPARRSWVDTAPDTPFPIQNLPFGVFRRRGETGPGRIGVAIGDMVLDVAGAAKGRLLTGGDAVLSALTQPSLNDLMAQGPAAWRAVRLAISRLLRADGSDAAARGDAASKLLVPTRDVEMQLPATIGDYTDFYASVHHATNVGRMLRPDNPLLPNYKWVPIGYHGRASSIGVSGGEVVRPNGQRKPPDAAEPSFGPSRNLDYETELGYFVGPGNALGKTIPIGQAAEHLFGVCLLNDWSARDIQAWEYQPLGPFLAKSFGSTISPWVVTFEALAPFRGPAGERPSGDPKPLPYLTDSADQAAGGLNIAVEILLASAKMRAAGLPPQRLASVNAGELYWTPAQMVTHHASNGCNLRPGDLLGSGTISGPQPDAVGSILELTQRGKTPVQLPSGESRVFIEDGDDIIMRGRCARDGHVAIGFGECRGTVRPAPSL
ncbi:MAG TPA: fumarylacetoacetase [Alphaproteobacteria bacterium]